MPITLDPHEIERQVVLAFALEATIPKQECTSRYKDIGPNQKFEYFLISAINSGRYFFELADRINRAQGQPAVIYDLAYEAMMDSQRSRPGKIVSYGLLEAMFPVVVARSVYGTDGLSALDAVPKVLRGTSKEDVRHVAEMRRVIYSRSNKEFKRTFSVTDDGNNLFEHYELHRKRAHEASGLFVTELLDGMPLTKTIYEYLQKDGSLEEKISTGYDEMRRMSKLPHGALADFTAAALYLMFADSAYPTATLPQQNCNTLHLQL